MNEEVTKLREALKDCLDAMEAYCNGNGSHEIWATENFQTLEDRYRSLVEAKEIKQ